MKLLKTLGMLCAILLGLTSCGNVTIKNGEWCGDLGAYGAECFHMNTDDTRSLNQAEWDGERLGWVCSAAENFGDVKKAILKLCKKCNCCDYDTASQAEKFDTDLKGFINLKKDLHLQ